MSKEFEKAYRQALKAIAREMFVDGRRVGKTDRSYGYGTHYLTTAFEWLADRGYVTGWSPPTPEWTWARNRGISLEHEAIDVPRRKDL